MRLFPWLDGHQVFAGLADGLTSVFGMTVVILFCPY